MSIDRTYALQNLDKPAVLCCRADANTFLSVSNLEDPAIFPDLIDSGLLNLDGCLSIGQVLGADTLGYSTLTVTCESLTPITSDIVDQYLEDAPIVYRPMSKLQVGDSYYEIVDETARAQGGHTELTQAEYNALSQAEKENGEVYFITDGTPDNLIVNDSVPIGAIQAYGGATAPAGWLMCDGSAVSRNGYSELFSAIGTTYGDGDGSTTFNLPDLQGRVAIGSDTNYVLGDYDGESEHILTESELPNVSASFALHGQENGTIIAGLGGKATGTLFSNKYNSTGYTNSPNIRTGANSYQTPGIKFGSDQAHNNMQPYIVTNYIIKAKDHSLLQASLIPMLDFIYPIGCYYETNDESFDPNVSLGGTWTSEEIGNDYIVEEGTDGIWTYRKWASGTAECWGVYYASSESITGSNPLNSGGKYWLKTINYPSAIQFIDYPTISTTASIGSGYAIMARNYDNLTGAQVLYYTSMTTTTASVRAGFYVIGKWKTHQTSNTIYKWHRTA